jgi:hypothetical protein
MDRDRGTSRRKEVSLKLSTEERERLNALIHKGKTPWPSVGEGVQPAEDQCLGGRRRME